jgi:hypothetical protein
MLKTVFILIVIAVCLLFIIWLELSLKLSRFMTKNRKIENIAFISVSAIVILLSILWSSGLMRLWANGISFIANNTKDYNDASGHVIQGNYSVSIDLSNLESNLGKDLYNDGVHRIYVSHVDNTGSVNSGGYRVGFRACGQYSLNGATLISGVHHATVNDHSFTINMSAKMTSEYNGKIYNSQEFGTSGLNYKDGDDFAFYIFPTEAYDKNEVSLDEKGTVRLTVTNLYENVWSKNR